MLEESTGPVLALIMLKDEIVSADGGAGRVF